MPIGIVGTLILCAVLYGSVALVLTGVTRAEDLGQSRIRPDAVFGQADHYLTVDRGRL